MRKPNFREGQESRWRCSEIFRMRVSGRMARTRHAMSWPSRTPQVIDAHLARADTTSQGTYSEVIGLSARTP